MKTRKQIRAATRNIMRWERKQAIWNRHKGMAVGILIGGLIVSFIWILSL
jgi:hypothetical protein